ncbi:hypothetical protein SEA_LILHUDDY_84 [Arthrobacter phage LilHuddy]|nr:hypothetical protein SEA_LILHUDDY_84 [Arthrobacter phage LilHuddy]
MTEKLEIFQWQQDALVDLLYRKVDSFEGWQKMWRFIDEHFEVQKQEQVGENVKNVYVFFGYKQDAVRYRLEHDIDPRDMVNVKDAFDLLAGRRARPIRVNQDSKWCWLNWNHQMSVDARARMYALETLYGSAQ